MSRRPTASASRLPRRALARRPRWPMVVALAGVSVVSVCSAAQASATLEPRTTQRNLEGVVLTGAGFASADSCSEASFANLPLDGFSLFGWRSDAWERILWQVDPPSAEGRFFEPDDHPGVFDANDEVAFYLRESGDRVDYRQAGHPAGVAPVYRTFPRACLDSTRYSTDWSARVSGLIHHHGFECQGKAFTDPIDLVPPDPPMTMWSAQEWHEVTHPSGGAYLEIRSLNTLYVVTPMRNWSRISGLMWSTPVLVEAYTWA